MKTFCTVLSLGLSLQGVQAEDWPVWRGPAQDGISKEKNWRSDWGGDEPKQLWKANVGAGFSAMTISQGRLFTMGLTGKTENIVCLDAVKGTQFWKHSYPTAFKPMYYEGGTSGTPTVEGDHVFVLGQMGELFCLKASDGKVVWEKNIKKELDLKVGMWGFTGAPLVHGDLLILNAGTHGVAVNKKSGAVAWKSGTGGNGYASPVLFNQNGKSLVALFSERMLFAVDAASGAKIWEFPWETQYDINSADPIIHQGELFFGSGYGRGGALLKIASSAPEKVWEKKEVQYQMNPGLHIDGYVYGPLRNADDKPALGCVEWATGKIAWEEKSTGVGALTAADGKLIVLSDKGEIVIAEANPTAFKEVSRFQAVTGKCWTAPVLSHARLYSRNSKGDLVCHDLSKK
jgi:outer membrane protein assembly factor BamB